MMNFQTPPVVADYMVSLCLGWIGRPKWLEPTPGQGNIVAAIKRQYPEANITAPKDFWKLKAGSRFHLAVMNPPFSPMAEGFRYLYSVMGMTDYIIALLPWFIIINSERRQKEIIDNYGLQSITHLPRKTFPGTRIQCYILQMQKGYKGPTIFKTFDF